MEPRATLTTTLDMSGFVLGGTGTTDLREYASLDLLVKVSGTGLIIGDTLNIDPSVSLGSGGCEGWNYCDRQRAETWGYGGFKTGSFSNTPLMIPVIIPIQFGRGAGLHYVLDLHTQTSSITWPYGYDTSATGMIDYSHRCKPQPGNKLYRHVGLGA